MLERPVRAMTVIGVAVALCLTAGCGGATSAGPPGVDTLVATISSEPDLSNAAAASASALVAIEQNASSGSAAAQSSLAQAALRSAAEQSAADAAKLAADQLAAADAARVAAEQAAADQAAADAARGAAAQAAADQAAADQAAADQAAADQAARVAAEQAAPAAAPAPVEGAAGGNGCTIKGNINSKGEKIFHVDGKSPSYDDTVVDESAGERWFCSEAEALAAGWRAPKNAR